jgi:hypothetical protein
MRSLATLLLSGSVFAAAALVVADGSSAVSFRQSNIISKPAVQLVARKGTRNYVPGEDHALAVPSNEPKRPERNSLEECMAIWDAGTHITKTKWREICKRQIKERADAYSSP